MIVSTIVLAKTIPRKKSSAKTHSLKQSLEKASSLDTKSVEDMLFEKSCCLDEFAKSNAATLSFRNTFPLMFETKRFVNPFVENPKHIIN